MAVKRARSLERWLTRLIAAYQDPRTRPRRAFDNLTELSFPTQAYAIAVPRGSCHVGVILIAHDVGAPNGFTRAVFVDDVAALAEFASQADSILKVGTFHAEHILDGFLFPSFGLAEQACINLADYLTTQPPKLSRGAFTSGSRMWMQTSPPAALWNVTYRSPLPDPASVLSNISSPKVRRRQPQPVAETQSAPVVPSGPQFRAFGGYPEPGIWFGDPPFLSSAARILKQLWLWPGSEKLIWSGAVAGIQVFTYNTGLSVAKTPDRRTANRLLNHFFGVLDRSGDPPAHSSRPLH